jgi:hypothetical protein
VITFNAASRRLCGGTEESHDKSKSRVSAFGPTFERWPLGYGSAVLVTLLTLVSGACTAVLSRSVPALQHQQQTKAQAEMATFRLCTRRSRVRMSASRPDFVTETFHGYSVISG